MMTEILRITNGSPKLHLIFCVKVHKKIRIKNEITRIANEIIRISMEICELQIGISNYN